MIPPTVEAPFQEDVRVAGYKALYPLRGEYSEHSQPIGIMLHRHG